MKTRKKGNLNKKRKKLKVICREVRTHDQTEKQTLFFPHFVVVNFYFMKVG